MDQPTLVLIHSPLVGPATWGEVASTLRSRHRLVVVPDLRSVASGRPPYYRKYADRVAVACRRYSDTGRVVLVGHSGAGALLPLIAEALDKVIDATLFVDAILPHPGQSWFDTAPADLHRRLLSMATGGALPPWHQWFPAGTLERLLPDAMLRGRFIAEIQEVPLAYLEERAPLVQGWPPGRCGYLQLSPAYDSELNDAVSRGWWTAQVPLGHLGMLTAPEAVLDALDSYLGSIGDSNATTS